MGNLFIGFPVPRAKIATMIEEAAPPLNHVENHEPDGSDPIVLPDDITTDQLLQWDGEKFIGADVPEAEGFPSPVSIHACQFNPVDDQDDYTCDESGLKRRLSLDSAVYWAPVLLPHAVTVTRVTVYAFRDDGSAPFSVYLYRVSNTGVSQTMAYISIDLTSGNLNKFDSSIDYSTVDNDTYSYCIRCYMNPNDSVDDIKLYRIKIAFE